MLLLTLLVVGVAFGLWQTVHRSSKLVQRWHASSFPRRAAGSLSVLDSGPTGHDDEQVVILLHGLGATGNYFGAFYDGLSRRRRVVIVDLLGFGHSMDEQRSDFGLDDHVDAIDGALDALGLGASRVVLAAHSMSSVVALSWADRHRERTEHVYLWGPPVYPDAVAARAVAKEHGVMGRLFVLDTRWAERACRMNCANRELSGALMTLMAPRWPAPVSSDASQHTWDAYRISLHDLILDVDWSGVFPASVPVTVFRGADDPIGDHAHIASLVGASNVVTVAGADHHIALQHPELLFDALGA
jgi:pimeloyl-ACP methyl ester carboxylesterase